MKKFLIFLVVVAVVVFYIRNRGGEPEKSMTDMMMENEQSSADSMMMDDGKKDEVMESSSTYAFSGVLADVSDGNATGVSMANFADGVYSLVADFSDLPEPEGTDFYEGWIVRKSPFDFISTGEAEKKDGKYMNFYSASSDLTDHDFYVLTIEPDDGDPAPAGHILEGTMISVN